MNGVLPSACPTNEWYSAERASFRRSITSWRSVAEIMSAHPHDGRDGAREARQLREAEEAEEEERRGEEPDEREVRGARRERRALAVLRLREEHLAQRLRVVVERHGA